MARARHFNRSFGGKSRRLTEWSQLADQSHVAVAAAGATLISSLSFESPATLVRNRGIIDIRMNSYAADGIVNGAFGMGVVTASVPRR